MYKAQLNKGQLNITEKLVILNVITLQFTCIFYLHGTFFHA